MNLPSMVPQIILIVGGCMIAAALIGALVASLKNRSADSWGFACFIFPPSLLILFLLPKGQYAPRRKISRRDLDEDIKDDLF